MVYYRAMRKFKRFVFLPVHLEVSRSGTHFVIFPVDPRSSIKVPLKELHQLVFLALVRSEVIHFIVSTTHHPLTKHTRIKPDQTKKKRNSETCNGGNDQEEIDRELQQKPKRLVCSRARESENIVPCPQMPNS